MWCYPLAVLCRRFTTDAGLCELHGAVRAYAAQRCAAVRDQHTTTPSAHHPHQSPLVCPILTTPCSVQVCSYPFLPICMYLCCIVSGTTPEEPVISAKSGHVYERRLVEKYIDANGKCPVTGEPLTTEDLIGVKSMQHHTP